MFKGNDKKAPQPQKPPVRKEERKSPYTPTRDGGKNGQYQPQHEPKPDPRPVKK